MAGSPNKVFLPDAIADSLQAGAANSIAVASREVFDTNPSNGS